jgi:GrpB-like predicted nucleotidyltransferase (UPF0157 family)
MEDRDRQTRINEAYQQENTAGELKPLSTPVLVVDYDTRWPDRFEHEARRIRMALGTQAWRIEHVGSTAVPGLPAKPIIDILLVVADSASEMAYAGELERAGYQLQIREREWHEHRMFKGAGDDGDDVNLHVFSAGCPEVARMLAFRDWLRANDADRELYARCKRALARQEWKYIQNYADAKTPVVLEILSRAREQVLGANDALSGH